MKKRRLCQDRPSGRRNKLLCWMLLSTVAVTPGEGWIRPPSSSTSSSSSSLPIQCRGGAFGRGSSDGSSGGDQHPDADRSQGQSGAAVDVDVDETPPPSEGPATDDRQGGDNAAVREYVAAMRERDGRDRPVGGDDKEDEDRDEGGPSSPSSSSSSLSASSPDGGSTLADAGEDDGQQDEPTPPPEAGGGATGPDGGEDSSVVGVKAHGGAHHHNKKSNAVGDPDDDDDDDDDDDKDDDSLSEQSEEWEELEEFADFVEDIEFADFVQDAVVVEPHVQVEVELVEGDGMTADVVDDADEEGAEEEEGAASASTAATKGGGGVGVRLGRLGGRRRNNRQDLSSSTTTTTSWRRTASPLALESNKVSHDQTRLMEAWLPHVYFPPSKAAISYLSDHARLLDASSKTRLDRRTLYAALLLEWGVTDGKLSSRTRKFVPAGTSLALQAALSLATQPQWRQSAPRTSGIRLYQDEDATKGCTLGMQETVAMALVSTAHDTWYFFVRPLH
jgi:hypothetical protein